MTNSNTNLPAVQVEIVNGKPAVTSLQVAEAFGKDHDRVLKDIRNLLENDDFSADNFDATSYMDTCNRQKPMFILSRDGFLLLVMGYTGPKAMSLKKAYIQKFNEMEAALASQRPTLPTDYATALRALADTVEQKALMETKLALAAPKAEVYDKVVADKNMTIARFARTLRGVNTNNTKGDLYTLNYLYKMNGVYRVFSKFRDTYFTEKVNGYNGRVDILVLDKGKQELVKLYHDGKLTMKKGEKPCARRS